MLYTADAAPFGELDSLGMLALANNGFNSPFRSPWNMGLGGWGGNPFQNNLGMGFPMAFGGGMNPWNTGGFGGGFGGNFGGGLDTDFNRWGVDGTRTWQS